MITSLQAHNFNILVIHNIEMFPLQLHTHRLHIEELAYADASFILNLVNTEGWLKYIGNRNIYTLFEAAIYIQSILDNRNFKFWTVKLKNSNKSIGLISIIKREYLHYPDLGFAFLPEYTHLGYAFEATNIIVKQAQIQQKYNTLLATTLPTNHHSIKLLKKLGFLNLQQIEVKNEKMNLYILNKN
ncbi:GNAT family N-acetyltransferase [Myroides phaeus]|uniref:GNAT family N-acetyltransferase n=1 Tax=Myroides phaeus TaxID=702745 RepID=UPI001E342D31|nr:GNAT family N-acetyltransferase [Myroides phaeus]